MHRIAVVAVLAVVGAFTRPLAATEPRLSAVSVVQSWRDEGTPNGQCGGKKGEFATPFGSYSEAIKFDTDDREGGCIYRVAIVDPDGALAARHWHLSIVFTPQGHVGQCKYPGSRAVPVVAAMADVAAVWEQVPWRDPIIIDTDDRVGGCVMEFQITAPEAARAPVLDIRFLPDGDPAQCPQSGDKVASPGHPAALIINTDSRPGGCLFQMRLRE